MKTWTIRRAGTFVANPVGDHHCGTGANLFRFEAKMTTTRLDKMGFVADQLEMLQRAGEDKEIIESCEEHAETLAHRMLECVDFRLRKFVTNITVLVGPPDGQADITFSYNPNEKATKA